MSWMSELDIMVQEGLRTAEDFEGAGYDRDKAEAMASIVKETDLPGYGRPEAFEAAADEAFEVLSKFGLIDGEGFYTIYETKR